MIGLLKHGRQDQSHAANLELILPPPFPLLPLSLPEPLEEITPWFADFRDMILGNRLVSEHETFNHPVASE